MEVTQPKPESRSLTPDSPPVGPPGSPFRPQRQPMFWAALAYALGVIFGHYQSRPASWWIGAGAALIAASIYFLHRRTMPGRTGPSRIWLAGSLALGALFLAGALHIQLRGDSSPLDDSIQPFTGGNEVEII